MPVLLSMCLSSLASQTIVLFLVPSCARTNRSAGMIDVLIFCLGVSLSTNHPTLGSYRPICKVPLLSSPIP
ncbi:hypothetical protein BJV78DRAFT_1177670 [Lactifluus subvellereus]|nr:hypothetical protein BJV78DRAFT_1177670 [Lactifluus subvellereus]